MTKPRIVATYDYKSEDGTLLYQVLRYEPKSFKQRRPDGKDGSIWNLTGVTRVLYRLPELATMPADAPVFIAEGEKDVDNLCTHLGLCATCNSGGAGKFTEDLRGPLKGRHVVVIADKDPPGWAHAQQVAALLYGFAASVKVLELPGDSVKDASDWLAGGGTREQLETLVAATPVRETPRDGAEVLNAVEGFIRRFVILTQEQADAVTLWTAHTHGIEFADSTPYLDINSAEKRSGKTRLQECLELFVRNPWFTSRASAAVLPRKIDAEAPTLLLDESDAAFKSGDEYSELLRGILNSGHRRGGKHTVCVGQGANITPRDFSTFCPKAISGIGRLPGTIGDRSISVTMKRRTKAEKVEHFRFKTVTLEAAPVRERLVAWVSSLDLQDATPELPSELDDRAADGWEPLLAIADAAGGDWPQRARAAALALSAGVVREDQSLGVRLLTDIAAAFRAKASDKLASAELVKALNSMEESPWADLGRRPLDANRLARMLKPYGIAPKTIRLDATTSKGYVRETFFDSWNRYAPALSGGLAVTPVTTDTTQIQGATRNTAIGSQANVTGNGQIANRFNVTPVTGKSPGSERAVTSQPADGQTPGGASAAAPVTLDRVEV